MAQGDFNVEDFDPKKVVRVVISAVVVIATIVVLWKSSITIGSGDAGVLFKTLGDGVQTDQTYGEGFHIIAPWNKMIVYSVRQQEVKEKMAVLSSNGLEITIEVSTWYEPDYASLPLLHQKRGATYEEKVVRPSIRSATRSVIGRYTPEEIYSTKRDAIQEEIFEETKKILDRQYIQTNEVLVRDITLPPTIKQAIEKKLRQEQESLEYEFKITKATKEAERLRIEAEGKAAANRILNASLTPNILKEKGIEATVELSNSANAKTVIIGNSEGLPLILGNQ